MIAPGEFRKSAATTAASSRAESLVITRSPTIDPTTAIRQRVGETVYRNAARVSTAPRTLMRLSLVTNVRENHKPRHESND